MAHGPFVGEHVYRPPTQQLAVVECSQHWTQVPAADRQYRDALSHARRQQLLGWGGRNSSQESEI